MSLGDSVREKTDEWHLLTDPDVYAGGRLFALEGGSFRNVFLMTDFLSESWDKSVVDGIRVDEGCLFGLRIGETTLKEWREALGEPDFMVDFDGERAEAWFASRDELTDLPDSASLTIDMITRFRDGGPDWADKLYEPR